MTATAGPGPASASLGRLWSSRQRVLLAATGGIGAVLTVTGWWSLSGSGRASGQAGGLVVEAVGVVLAACGGGLWFMAGRRTVGLRTQALLGWADDDTDVIDLGLDAADELVASPSMLRYHRPGCPLVADKVVHSFDLGAHEAAGRRPCGVCEP